MVHLERLDRASSSLFFFGFLASKLQKIPFYPVQMVFTAISLLCYLAGYLVWLTASLIRPHHPRKKKWYGFAHLNIQHSLSATIGAIASMLSLLSLALPILALPACWLFLLSNTIWLISEYHRLKHPPNDPGYHQRTQQHYLNYALVMTMIAFVVAMSFSISVFIPGTAVFAVAASSILCAGLGMLAFEFWLKYQFEPAPIKSVKIRHQETPKPKSQDKPIDPQPGTWHQLYPETKRDEKLAKVPDDGYSSEPNSHTLALK